MSNEMAPGLQAVYVAYNLEEKGKFAKQRARQRFNRFRLEATACGFLRFPKKSSPGGFQLLLKLPRTHVLQNSKTWSNFEKDILSKYNRVDSAELKALKERITTLEKERDEIKTEYDSAVAERDEARTALQKHVDDLSTVIKNAKAEQKTVLETQFKEVLRKNRTILVERKAELDAALAEKVVLQKELDSAKAQLAVASAQGGPPKESDGIG
ncbi:hypothetical protein PV08_11737 [Exophiala spinifera]|uniref:Uncharacterized protein n=1 Tax=Exophiala spinifera TaxID=91928 RepID=A0A0D1Y4W2_9EURO|nr:uncharacterized protein PV08_11737 [Exophiala spinifera]KIW09961.1 hypothetical protein PV08_11737 [Exophiala spinifera]